MRLYLTYKYLDKLGVHLVPKWGISRIPLKYTSSFGRVSAQSQLLWTWPMLRGRWLWTLAALQAERFQLVGRRMILIWSVDRGPLKRDRDIDTSKLLDIGYRCRLGYRCIYL